MKPGPGTRPASDGAGNAAAPAGTVHRVSQGESLSRIAKRYGTTSAQIAKANGIANPDRIAVGQTLVIAANPAPTTSPTTPPTGRGTAPPVAPTSQTVAVHEIQPGETLYSIARRYQIEPRDIQAYNAINDPTLIWAGQEIRIPGSSATGTAPPNPARDATTTSTYTVAKGDSLSKIAQRFATTVPDLQAANALANPNALSIGQKLTIPGDQPSTAAAPTPASATKPGPKHAFGHNGDRRVDPPAPETEDSGAGEFLGYHVIQGDTVESIAAIFDTSPDTLRRINDLPDGGQFKAGQKILIPAAAVFTS